MKPPPNSSDAAAWLARGQSFEAQATPTALAAAVQCYESAIALLRAAPAADAAVRRDLAVAHMNRGNALQRISSAESLPAAVLAYDEAIALLAVPGFEENASARNSLGAAWMNRGLALHRQTGAASLAAAVRSQHEAIAVLQMLPLGESPWYRRNLAAARMNLANALLDSDGPDRFALAGDAARAALTVVVAEENSDPIAADLALKARRCLCDALGHQFAANEADGVSNETAAAEASDTVDAALALIREWEQRGVQSFRPLAERFFRFGAHFYRLHQPHFLAEFVLENLDPEHSPGLTGVRELHAIADDALTLALKTLRQRPVFIAGKPEENRLLQTSRELQTAKIRLAALRQPG